MGFTAGPVEEIRDHVRYFRYVLSKGQYQKLRALIPENSQFTGVLKEEEYEKSGKILVYEKLLGKDEAYKSDRVQNLQIV
jgi:hypothetical protein